MLVRNKLIPVNRDHECYAVSFDRCLVFRHHHTGLSACGDAFMRGILGYVIDFVVLMGIPESGSVCASTQVFSFGALPAMVCLDHANLFWYSFRGCRSVSPNTRDQPKR